MIEGWELTTWGALADLRYGRALKAGNRRGGDVPVYGTNGQVDWHDEALAEGPGVIVGRKGAYRGVEYCSSDFFVIDTAFWLEPKRGVRIDMRWAAYQLLDFDINNLDSGSALPSTSKDAFAAIPVAVPPYDEQRRIAQSLAAFDDLIENNQQQIEILEEMARLIYRKWFVHFRFPGHEDVDLVDSDLGWIPEGWEASPASAVFDVNPRERVDKYAVHKFVTMGDLDESGMVCWSSELRLGSSGAKFRNGDTLFARITPCLENGKTGFVACLDEGEIGRGSTEFIVLRGASVGPEFTYLTAREDGFRQNAIKSMSGASGRQRVRNECFDDYLLAVPTREVEEEFRRVVGPMFDLVFSLARQSATLAEARDLLLPRLISGELDVSDLHLDLDSAA